MQTSLSITGPPTPYQNAAAFLGRCHSGKTLKRDNLPRKFPLGRQGRRLNFFRPPPLEP